LREIRATVDQAPMALKRNGDCLNARAV
jgi:hypothetical protein